LAGLIEDAKKSPNGAVHQLVYGDARGMFADLGSAAENLKTITATVAKGDGTVGGLISDPTVYEDLREVLGNVKRNRILRALVRFSLNNREDLEKIGEPQKEEKPVAGVGAVASGAEPAAVVAPGTPPSPEPPRAPFGQCAPKKSTSIRESASGRSSGIQWLVFSKTYGFTWVA
jgi:phospholipid/cholesterol/gamma-HCH transport system substrate-binding protein